VVVGIKKAGAGMEMSRNFGLRNPDYQKEHSIRWSMLITALIAIAVIDIAINLSR
jgi:hypothetical protein